MSEYVDAHCHVDRYGDPRAVLAAARAAGVITVAVTEMPSRCQRQQLLLKGTPGVRIAVGVHPMRAHQATPMELGLFRRLVERSDYVGEVGLDFSRDGMRTRDRQSRVFDSVLSHPNIRKKVLSVHSRGAEADCIDRLSAANAVAILHWYSGPLGQIDRALVAGLYFSVNPAMLNSRNGQRILDRIPRERVLTETDGPYTKVGHRIAEPSDIPWLVEQLAARWAVDVDEAKMIVFENMTRAFTGAPH